MLVLLPIAFSSRLHDTLGFWNIAKMVSHEKLVRSISMCPVYTGPILIFEIKFHDQRPDMNHQFKDAGLTGTVSKIKEVMLFVL